MEDLQPVISKLKLLVRLIFVNLVNLVWITPDQVNNDMVKLLRNCKKLPDKNNAFYKVSNTRFVHWLCVNYKI